MLILTQRLTSHAKQLFNSESLLTLTLVAEDRTRSRHHFTTAEGEAVNLQLPRGTVLKQGDFLADEHGQAIAKVVAQPEPVLTVTTDQPLDFLRAAYHLGNRHIALEITESYLRLSPDSVLEDMVCKMGLKVIHELQPFQPETGAYHHHEH